MGNITKLLLDNVFGLMMTFIHSQDYRPDFQKDKRI